MKFHIFNPCPEQHLLEEIQKYKKLMHDAVQQSQRHNKEYAALLADRNSTLKDLSHAMDECATYRKELDELRPPAVAKRVTSGRSRKPIE